MAASDDSNTDDAPYSIKDPEKLAGNMMLFLSEGARALTRYMDEKRDDGPYAVANELGEAGKVLGEIAQQWMMTEPDKLAARQTKLTEDLTELWGRTYLRFLGGQVEPVAKPAQGDVRFSDPEWSSNPFFDFWKQAYLITSNWADDMVRHTDGVDDATRRRAQFYLTQITSALSPSNFPMTNPEVLRATLSSNGENLRKGMAQLVKDLDESQHLLHIKQTDLSAFAVGKNLAVTPGKVVFQNEVMQLIQYAPTTPDVFAVPLMIVPPWINKFYVLDLVPQKSFIRWLVDQGVTVFVVSWVNPDGVSNKSFEDYMREGILAGLNAVQRATGAAKINTLGYCVGGTLLGTTLAFLAAQGDTRVNSATFLAAQVDFAHAGDLLVFIDDTQIKALEAMMAERGYLDGSRMAAVFNMLRPKDLIWPYIVNNYLLGKQPFPFDLLYWNADTTRMPPANHSFYLREFYQANKLARGEMTIGGVKLDLGKVTLPVYELATREDHIAPAKSVFAGARLFSGPVRFVLAGSGHIAGVINPPARQKYMHWEPPANGDPKNWPGLEEWIAAASEAAGSWWPDYAHWLMGLSGEKIPARQPGEGGLPPIEDAPGSYVRH